MRPEHLHCPNTAEGIRRINEMQEAYDRDPEGWERQEREAEEQRQMEEERQREEYNRWVESNHQPDVDDKIDEWHNSSSKLPLHEYLGMTMDEYVLWLKTPKEEI